MLNKTNCFVYKTSLRSLFNWGVTLSDVGVAKVNLLSFVCASSLIPHVFKVVFHDFSWYIITVIYS